MKRTLLATLLWAGLIGPGFSETTAQLLEKLNAMDPEVRAKAVTELMIEGMLEGKSVDRIVPALLQQMAKDPAESVRRVCVTWLVQLALQNPDSYAAAVAKGLEAQLQESDAPLRLEIYTALLSIPASARTLTRPQLIQELLKEAAGEEPELRAGALNALLISDQRDPLVIQGIGALWQKQPEDAYLLEAMKRLAGGDEATRRSLEPVLLQLTESADSEVAVNSFAYFSQPRTAWSVRQQLYERLEKNPQPKVRAQAALSYSLAFADSESWTRAVHQLSHSQEAEARELAVRLIAMRGQVPPSIRPDWEHLSRDPELGAAVLSRLISEDQAGPERLPEVLKLLQQPAQYPELLEALPRWKHAGRTVPQLVKSLAAERSPDVQLALCKCLLELEQGQAALGRVRQLAAAKDPNVALQGLMLLNRYPQVATAEILELSRRHPETLSFISYLSERPKLTWGRWVVYLQDMIRRGSDTDRSLVLSELYGKAHRPGVRALYTELYKRSSEPSTRLNVGQQLFDSYGDRRVVDDAIRALDDSASRSIALSVLQGLQSKLLPAESQRLTQALLRPDQNFDSSDSSSVARLLWSINADVAQTAPFLYRNLELNYSLLDEMPVEAAAAQLQTGQLESVGDYLSRAAGRSELRAAELGSLCQVLVTAYPRSAPLVPKLKPLLQAKDETVQRLVAATLEKMQ